MKFDDLTDRQKQRITEMWDDGHTCPEIGRRFGAHGDTVRKWLRRLGAAPRSPLAAKEPEDKPPDPTPDEIEAMCKEIRRTAGWHRRRAFSPDSPCPVWSVPEVKVCR